MRFKKLIAAISAAAMLLPALPFIPGTAPVAEAATEVTNEPITIEKAIQLRSAADSPTFQVKFNDSNLANKSSLIKGNVTDQIQIFANPNASHCGAYYQFVIPEDMQNATLTFSYRQQGTFNISTDSAKLHFAAVGVPEDLTVDNAFSKVKDIFQITATEEGHPQLKAEIKSQYKEANTRGNNAAYNVDITSLVTDGTNIAKGKYALFVYAEPGVASTFYSIDNASITARGQYQGSARIGESYYDDLIAAYTAAKVEADINKADTVTLVTDNNISSSRLLTGADGRDHKSLTITSAGKTITVNKSASPGGIGIGELSRIMVFKNTNIKTTDGTGNAIGMNQGRIEIHEGTVTGNVNLSKNSPVFMLDAATVSGNILIYKVKRPNGDYYCPSATVKLTNNSSVTGSIEIRQGTDTIEMDSTAHIGTITITEDSVHDGQIVVTKSGSTALSPTQVTTVSAGSKTYDLETDEAGNLILADNSVVKHQVTFDSNGGSAVSAQKVFENETATKPAAPTREGCTFDGWMLNGAAYDFSTPVTGDITLTASWKSNTGDTLIEEKIDLTGSAVKLYRFPLTGGTYKYAEEVTSNATYKALVDGVYTDASIPANNYVMIDLGKEYNISTLKAYQNDITTAGTGGNFVAVLPGCKGTSSEFVKADLNDLIRTNASYNTLTTEHGTNCFTYSQLTSDKHNMGSYRYIILHNGGNYVLNLAEVEVYEDKTEKNAYLSVRNFYNDHMVLQRGKPHVIKGYSATGTIVSVIMTDGTNTQTAAATPDSEGNWTASVPAMPAGLTPYTITITDDKGGSVTLSDVLVGDVFLASGQSNMAYEAPRTATQNITQYSNTGGPAGSVYYKKGLYELQYLLANENIRFIKMRDDTAAESGLVTENVPIWIDWMKSSDKVAETSSAGVATGNTSEGILQMSTLAAFFADARIKAEPGIPVGIIQASRGGSAINIWSEGGRLYNNHLAPLDELNIAGILWYQGCANSNATGFTTYHSDFEALIKNYRDIFNDSTLPFMYVQLAPYKNNKPEYENAGSQRFQVMREIQREMLDDADVNTNLYMAVSMDTTQDSHHDNSGNIVNASLIHPLGKDTLGRRMAAAYKEMKTPTGTVVNGPLVSGATVSGDTVTVSFKSGTADGLKVLNPDYTYQHKGQVGWQSDTTELEEFKLAGEDGIYYNATAVIDGKTVKVTSAYVTEPKYVSYAYSELPKNPNLGNGAGLPASPFNISVDGSAAPVAKAQTAAVTEYEVTMNSNGGSKVEPQTVVSGEKAKQPTAPTKSGYVFSGWYTDSGLTTEYDFDTAVSSNMTLYAKWSEVVSTYDSDYFKFESNSSNTISISKVVLDITQGGKSGTATKTYSDPVTISAGSAVDFYIRITGVPEGTEITKISLY